MKLNLFYNNDLLGRKESETNGFGNNDISLDFA